MLRSLETIQCFETFQAALVEILHFVEASSSLSQLPLCTATSSRAASKMNGYVGPPLPPRAASLQNPDTEGSAYTRIYREQKAPFSTPNNAPAVPDSQTLLVRRPPTAESLADLRNPSADPFNPAVVYQQPQLLGQGGAPSGGGQVRLERRGWISSQGLPQYGGYGNEGSYRQGGPLHSGNQQVR